MLRSGGAEGIFGKLTQDLWRRGRGSALVALPTGYATCWWSGKAKSSGLNTLKEALRGRSALVARAGVNHASFSQHVSFISPKTGFLSSARKDPGQSGTQNSQNLLSGLIRQWGTPARKQQEQTRKQEAFQ